MDPVLLHVTTSDISLALLLGNQLSAFRDAGFQVVGASAPGPFVEEIESRGVRHIPLHSATRTNSLTSDLKTAWELRTIIKDLRPTIVHTHNPKPGIYGRLVARMTGVPIVINTVHGLYATRDDPLVRRAAVYAIECLAAACSDAELVQNAEDLVTLRKLGIPSRRLHLVGNGIDLMRFSSTRVSPESRRQLRSELGASDETLIVTTVGRLVGEKGLREFITVAKQLRGSRLDAIFVIVGPKEPMKSDRLTDAEIDSARLAGVRVLGHRSDVETIYAASDLFVLASYREGVPRSAMEASAMGLPTVATRIRGCRQVVDDGVTGVLVPARDTQALRVAIESLLVEKQVREQMGRAAVSKARQEFDERTVIETTLSVYHDLLLSTK